MKNITQRMIVAAAAAVFSSIAVAPAPDAAGDPEATAAKAFELRMAGGVDDAVKLLETALNEDPQEGVLHYELSRSRLFLLDIAGMHEAAEAAVRHEPDNNDFRYFAAMASAYALIDAAHHGDKEKMRELGAGVIDHLEAILRANPHDHRARWFLVQQSTEMAPEVGLEVASPEEHVRLLEKEDPIWGAKARCLLVDEKEQLKIWNGILSGFPEDHRALTEAAEGLIMAGDLELASKCLDKAIEKDPESNYGLLQLGLAYAMREEWDQALGVTQRYLDSDPPIALKAFAIGRMGMIHHRKGEAERGRELMSEARKLDPHVWQTVMPPPKEIFTPL